MRSSHPISHIPLEFIAAAVTRVPVLLGLASLLLCAASVWYTASFMTLRTARNDLLSSDLPYNQRFLAFVQEFSTLEGGLIVVDATDPDRAIAYAKDLVADLDPRLPVGTRTKFRIEDEAFLEKAILLLPPEELERIASAVAGGADLIGGALTPRGLESLFNGIGTRAAKAGGRGDIPPEAVPALIRLIRGLSDAVAGEDPPGPLLAGWSDSKGRYFWSDDGRFLFIEIHPYPELDAGLSAIVRESMDRVAPRHPGLEVGLTGRPVLAQDEMVAVSSDMLLASVVSVVGVAALFILFFRNFFQPLLAVLTLMVGISWSFGAATLIIGHLNLLSVIFGV
ncbi:MAG: MMPL family transporter, partial [Planctomycetota bacterium]|nr:MMPL family transporter [Planctomycetota bacterium]